MSPGRILFSAIILMLATNVFADGDLRWTIILQAVLRWSILVAASYLIASARPGWRGVLRGVGAAIVIVFIVVFLELSVFVLTGRAAAERQGPPIVLGFLMAAPAIGFVGGAVGAGAAEIRRRWGRDR